MALGICDFATKDEHVRGLLKDGFPLYCDTVHKIVLKPLKQCNNNSQVYHLLSNYNLPGTLLCALVMPFKLHRKPGGFQKTNLG